MSAQAIIDHARELGITLRAEDDNIHYAPKSAAPPELVEELRQHKPEVLAALMSPPAAPVEQALLAWATRMTPQDNPVTLDHVVSYVERKATTVTTKRVGFYAVMYLAWIDAGRMARLPHSCPHDRLCPTCGPCPVCGPGCAERREREGWEALRALRAASEGSHTIGAAHAQ